jgi:hypothetical protein
MRAFFRGGNTSFDFTAYYNDIIHLRRKAYTLRLLCLPILIRQGIVFGHVHSRLSLHELRWTTLTIGKWPTYSWEYCPSFEFIVFLVSNQGLSSHAGDDTVDDH